MGSRLELQAELENILGSRNVYYQPPASVQMKYPAIVYSLSDIKNKRANDGVYKQTRCYKVTLIHKNPDNTTVDKISNMKYSTYNTSYVADNLYHFVFTLYY